MSTPTPPLRGRWAQGLKPRMFTWVIQDRLAGSERPGGFARNHRKVRRTEELIWLKHQGFTRVLSLLDSSHNLHAYEDAELPYANLPLGRPDELVEHVVPIYEQLAEWLDDPVEKVLVHHEEFGDRIVGVLGGFLYYAGFIDSGPHVIQLIERLTNRKLGAEGREVVATTVAEGITRV